MAPHEKFKVEITYREMMFFGDALSEVVVVKPCKVIALNILKLVYVVPTPTYLCKMIAVI